MNRSNTTTPSNYHAVFGGTFDPIHNAHIAMAEEVKNALALSSVHLMPCKVSPHKSATTASQQHRLNMLQLVCDNHPWLRLDLREIERETPSYTATSVQQIKQQYAEKTVLIIMGMDSLINFDTWYQWRSILDCANLVVCRRPKQDIADIPNSLYQYVSTDIKQFETEQQGRILLLNNSLCDVSATEIRSDITQHDVMLPDYIYRYIQQHQLYVE